MSEAREPRWLSRMMVDVPHHELIREHGGRYGVRDEGLIDSDLTRPRNRWAYETEADPASLAAAYAFGLAGNHGFIDGNKRVAFMALYVFLGMNGLDLEVPEPEVVAVMTGVADGRVGEEELAGWIRSRTVPVVDLEG